MGASLTVDALPTLLSCRACRCATISQHKEDEPMSDITPELTITCPFCRAARDHRRSTRQLHAVTAWPPANVLTPWPASERRC